MSVKMSSLPVVGEQESIDSAIMAQEATSRAVDLVNYYSQKSPYNDDPNNPWRKPQDILDKLSQARADVVSAWGSSTTTDSAPHHVAKKGSHDNNFRAIYIGMVTDAFAEELEAMRNNPSEELDVDVLVDCLQSGMDLLTQDEVTLMEQDHQQDTGPTPHELRRKQLGFHF